MKATWLLQAIVVNGAFFVFILYWLLVAPFKTSPIGPISYFTHGVNLLVVIADVWASNAPFYLMHGLYYFGYASLYITFSLVYWAAGGTDCKGNPYVYSVLNWDNFGSAATVACGVLLVFVPIVLTLMFCSVISCCRSKYRLGPPPAAGVYAA
jgi:hypothetical protein